MSNFTFSNLLLHDVERLSPARELNLVVGCDEEGWELWELFQVGAIVERGGKLWKIQGFTLDDLVVVSPYGLDREPGVRWVIFSADALNQGADDPVLRHKTGLVAFS